MFYKMEFANRSVTQISIIIHLFANHVILVVLAVFQIYKGIATVAYKIIKL